MEEGNNDLYEERRELQKLVLEVTFYILTRVNLLTLQPFFVDICLVVFGNFVPSKSATKRMSRNFQIFFAEKLRQLYVLKKVLVKKVCVKKRSPFLYKGSITVEYL